MNDFAGYPCNDSTCTDKRLSSYLVQHLQCSMLFFLYYVGPFRHSAWTW